MVLTTLLLPAALAQSPSDFSVLTTALFSPNDISWGNNTTIGSPALFKTEVTFFGNNYDLLVMFYETQVSGPTAACPAGTWGIGAAYSIDGGGFQEYGPIVQPGTDYYSCVAAHPTVVATSSSSWAVFFKAEQDTTGCDPLTSPWGCERYTGLGRFLITYVGPGAGGNAVVFDYTDPDPEPVLGDLAQDMGYPSVIYNRGQYRMVFAQNPDIYQVSSGITAFPGASPSLAIQSGSGSGSPSWNESELHSPSIYCESAGSAKVAVGGRVYDSYPTFLDQSVGRYDTTDLSTWSEAAWPYLRVLDGEPEVRHLDMTTSDNGTEYGMWFTSDVGGVNELYLLATGGFDVLTLDDKRCP
jgi:hypothetical protein